jgi:DNA invertase Pin-like site-specific DNA recombinase
MSDANSQNKSDSVSESTSHEPTNKIAIYLRSYTANESYVAMQERELREFVDRYNRHRPWGEVVAVFRDQGLVLDTFARPGLRALMSAIRRRQVTLILVPEFRDLAVLPREFFRILRFLDRYGCGLRSQHEYLLFERLRDDGELSMDQVKSGTGH